MPRKPESIRLLRGFAMVVQITSIHAGLYFENITLTGVCFKHTGEGWNESAIILEGFDEYGYALKDVVLKDIMVKRREDAPKQALTLYCLQGVKMENICCE